MDELKKVLTFGAVDQTGVVGVSYDSLLEYCYQSVDLLYVIVKDDPGLRRAALLVLNRVLELKFAGDMAESERASVTDFVLNVLIPVVRESPEDLAPLASSIFYAFVARFAYSSEDVMRICGSLGDPCYIPFLVAFLNHFDPPRRELSEFAIRVIGFCIQMGNGDVIAQGLKLLILYLVHYPEMDVYGSIIGEFVKVLPQTNTAEFWSNLMDIPNQFASAFLEHALHVLADRDSDVELRINVFYFVVLHFQKEHFALFDTFVNYLIELQAANLQMYDMVDVNLYSLFQVALENSEFRVDVSNKLKHVTLTLLKSDNIGYKVIGLYNLAYIIDNAPDLSYDLFTDGVQVIRPFLQSGNIVVVDAAIELLLITIGKQVSSTLDFEPVFNDILVLLTSGCEHIRNRCSILSYKYLKSPFVDSSWVFDKFLPIINSVKVTEQSIYLEILAKSIVPYRQTVTDEQIMVLLGFILEILRSGRNLEIKVSASFLWCALLTKDIDLCLREGLDSMVLKSFFRVLSNPNKTLRKTMAQSMILLSKCTFGAFNKLLSAFVRPLYHICCSESLFPVNNEPYLLAEMMKYDELPGASDFLVRLAQAIHQQSSPKQYNIATRCLKKVLWKTDIDIQLSVTKSVCECFSPGPTLHNSVALLISMLKTRSPLENRRRIAQIICSVFGRVPFESITSCIGAYCSLASYIMLVFGTETPSNINDFCKFLIEKTNANPSHYLHYAFFVFSECGRQGLMDPATTETLTTSAYSVIQQTKSNLDICSSLRYLKSILELSLDTLTPERLALILGLWATLRTSSTYQAAVDYTANILLYVACHRPIDPPHLLTVLEAFPPKQERCLTTETCNLLATLFTQDLPGDLKLAGGCGIIRLLASGKMIRYCNKTGPDTMGAMARLAIQLLNQDPQPAIAQVLADRPHKQELVTQLLHTLMS